MKNVTYHNPIHQEENTPLVTILEVRIDLKQATAIDTRKSPYNIDLAKASFGGTFYPELGSQWYLKKISGIWTLMARAPQQNPQLDPSFTPEPGDTFIGQGGTTTIVGDLVITGSGGGGANPLDIYPVDSLYLTLSPTFDPNVTWGGTWVNLEDRFLVGAGNLYNVADTGGAVSHTLTSANLGAHTHGVSGITVGNQSASHNHSVTLNSESSHTHGVGTYANGNQSASHSHSGSTLSTSTTGAHKHTLNRDNDAASGSGQWHLHSTGSGGTETTDVNVGSNGDHSHTVSGSTGTQSASHSHTISGSSAAGSSHTHTTSSVGNQSASHNHALSGTTDSTGSGTAVNHLPPYLAVYMWRRTA